MDTKRKAISAETPTQQASQLLALVEAARQRKIELTDAQFNLQRAEDSVKERLLELGMADCLSVNWSRLRRMLRA